MRFSDIPRDWWHTHVVTWRGGRRTAFEHAHAPGDPHPGITLLDGTPTYRRVAVPA